jgi:hypothetical protein
MLTTHALQLYKDFTAAKIAKARIVANGSYVTLPITKTETLADGRLAFYAAYTPESATAITVTELALLDSSLEVFMSKTLAVTTEKDERIKLADPSEGALIRFTFDIKNV